MRIRLSGWRKTAARLSLAAAIALGGYLAVLQLTGNVHEVLPGRLYRSATLSPERLARLVDDKGIRTIVNLRGEHPDSAWFQEEQRVARMKHVRLVSLSWSASRPLSDSKVQRFFRVVGGLEEPILIHCRSGSDRTGLASALYLARAAGADEETAESQLSIFYGHVGLPFFPAFPMDQTFERLEPALGYPNS
ncbi:tyrosine-protein phosphatase [Consotaella aegiceratis]|uniref:tyrosine-protein phosphatase n=1 Tax=Consotaella aegiceratis TaxID=3097961 RepID=UPI002F428A28